jgi:transposase
MLFETDEEAAELPRLKREGRSIEHIAQKLRMGYYPVRRRLSRARKLGRLESKLRAGRYRGLCN